MSLVSSIYSNPNNAACAYDITASKSANRKQILKATPIPRFVPDEISKAISQIQDALAASESPQVVRFRCFKALNILRSLNSSLRKRRDASTKGTGNA